MPPKKKTETTEKEVSETVDKAEAEAKAEAKAKADAETKAKADSKKESKRKPQTVPNNQRRWYKVELKTDTPMNANPCTVKAESDGDAWSKFCTLNHIRGSDKERTIEETDALEKEQPSDES